MLCAVTTLLAATSYVAPLSGMQPAAAAMRSSASPLMAANKKVISIAGFDDSELYEVREVDVGRPPVYLLKRIEDLRLATSVSEAGLLSAAEENGVFSTLENLGAFSLAEKALPVIEDLGVLTLMQDSLDIDSGLIFSLANWLIALAPIYTLVAAFGFLPSPAGTPFLIPALLVGLSTTAVGVAIFAWAFAVSKLQEDYE